MAQLNVSIPADLRDRVRARAEEEDRNVNIVVRRALELYLSQADAVDHGMLDPEWSAALLTAPADPDELVAIRPPLHRVREPATGPVRPDPGTGVGGREVTPRFKR